MSRRFTGWHMLGAMLGMFGLVIGVNVIMAHYAITTFGGTVVDNSYVASQHYNRWLAEARAQDALGWGIAATQDDARRVEIEANTPGGPLDGTVDAVASHPRGRAPERTLAFVRVGEGRYRSTAPLPLGRWRLHVQLRSGGRSARFEAQVG
ncbi:MAG: FixH family protein [Sphingomonas bacterium]|nr:FixH family protein [Sphingomonas bacterium]